MNEENEVDDKQPSKRIKLEDCDETPKTSWCGQKFCEKWLEYREFSGWLTPVIGEPFKAWCNACKRCLTAGKSELLKHAQTRKHQIHFNDYKAAQNCNDSEILTEFDSEVSYKMKPFQDDAVAAAEIKLAAYAVEHNLSGKAIDHLSELVKDLCQNPRLSKSLDLSRFKCGALIRNVLAKGVQQELDDELRQKCFSLLIDESVDSPNKKVFYLAVRYFSEARNKVKTEILAELTVNAMEPNAGMMSAAFKDLLERRGILFENIIGLAADSSSVMVGTPDSLQMMLMQNNPFAIAFTCISHSINIALSKAVQVLPRNLEDLLRNIATYRTQNDEYQAEIRELQNLLMSEVEKLPDGTSGSWLQLQPCISSLLEKLPGLELLFMHEPAESKSSITELVQNDLKNQYTKAYFLFLNYVLILFNSINSVYQTTNVLLPTLVKMCIEHFRTLCQHFMNPAAYTDVDIQCVLPYEENNLLPLSNIFVGTECQELLNQLDPAENEVFLMKCREFYQVATTEMKSRIIVTQENLEVFNFLDPQIALKPEGRAVIPSLEPLGVCYQKFLDITKLDTEWNELLQYFSEPDAEELQKLPIDSMWGIISDMRNDEDKSVFAELGKLAKIVLSLPVPNVEAEQVFCLMKDTKHKPRKFANSKTLHSLLMVKQAMIQDGTDCRQFTVTNRHLKLFRNELNYQEEDEENAGFVDEN